MPNPPILTTAAATIATAEQRRRFLAQWLRHLDDFHAEVEEIAARVVAAAESETLRTAATARLVGGWQSLIEEAHTAAYNLGQQAWARTRPLPMSDSDAFALREQKRFAFRFALDVSQGVPDQPGRMDAGARSVLYTKSIEGAYQRGTVRAAPPGRLIFWRLGSAERHCLDCPLLAANSPYTPETLPTVPKCGVQCGGNCKCSLEYRAAEGVHDAPAPQPKTIDDIERQRDIRDRVEGPRPIAPPGLRLPDEEERRLLQDLELRRNFAVRRADAAHARGDDAERDRWLGVRKDLQKRSIDFSKERGIWSVATFDAKEVMRGADIRAGDVDFLTHMRGIDGTTVHRANARAIEQSMTEARAGLDELLRSLPPASGAPIPDLRELFKLAGAPRAALTGHFEAAIWSGGLLLREAAATVPGGPADEVVVNVVGCGAEATLALPLHAVRELRATPLPVTVAPLGERWADYVLAAGVWLRGPADDVRMLVGAIEKRAGGRGVEVAPWQA